MNANKFPNIYTSYYAAIRKFTKNREYIFISISSSTPEWFNGDKYTILAPEWSLVNLYKSGKINKEEYKLSYLSLLNKRNINPITIINNLKYNSVLLCYEKTGDFCHRRILADWLNEQTGIIIPELK